MSLPIILYVWFYVDSWRLLANITLMSKIAELEPFAANTEILLKRDKF